MSIHSASWIFLLFLNSIIPLKWNNWIYLHSGLFRRIITGLQWTTMIRHVYRHNILNILAIKWIKSDMHLLALARRAHPGIPGIDIYWRNIQLFHFGWHGLPSGILLSALIIHLPAIYAEDRPFTANDKQINS